MTVVACLVHYIIPFVEILLMGPSVCIFFFSSGNQLDRSLVHVRLVTLSSINNCITIWRAYSSYICLNIVNFFFFWIFRWISKLLIS